LYIEKRVIEIAQRIFNYFIPAIGSYLPWLIVISVGSLLFVEGWEQTKWSIWFLGSIALLYVFIGSVLWEILCRFVYLKVSVKSVVIFLFIGSVYGLVTVAIVSSTIGEITPIAGISVVALMAVSGNIFHSLRNTMVERAPKNK